MVTLPSNLLDAIRNKNVVLFLGAGASWDAVHPKGDRIPTGNQLKDMVSDRFLGGSLKDRSLVEVSEYAINETDLLTFQRYIRDIFTPFEPAPYHDIISEFPWRAIFTTNLDLIIEKVYSRASNKSQHLVTFYKNAQKFDQELREVVNPLEFVKLHGSCDRAHETDAPFILATEQYAKYSENRSRLFSRLIDISSEYSIAFCGYSVLDPHIQAILHSMFSLGSIRPPYFLIKPNFDEVEERYWASKRMTPIRSSLQDFLESLKASLNPALISAGVAAMGSGHAIHKFYARSGAIDSPDLISFLDRDVTFIHSGISTEAISAEEFYKGYASGFSPIVSGMDASRNVTDTILVNVFLRADDTQPEPSLYAIQAPAGAGKSIILKRLAWAAATEFDSLVLFHNPQGSLRVSAIEEIYSHTGRRIFLLVDRAAYYVDEIADLLEQCKKKKLPVTIITAERENEWAVRCDRLDEKLDGRFDVNRLSKSEIISVLDKLTEFKALGRLNALSPDDRIKEFEVRADRQILVMLYELTQGIPFEKLIVDEYERIIPTEAQLLYLDICTLNRLNVPVRAGLISRVSNIHFSEFKSRFIDPLKRIVLTQHDEYIGDMLYSARHATIAQIVFENILVDQERRYNILVRLIRGMNLSYSSDELAFKSIVTGREIAELFPSQELGRRFFDIALEVAGSEPSLFQQRAIFEINHSGGSAEVGLHWIEKAEALRPHDRAIQHTKGNILRACASGARNNLLRDEYRRRAQIGRAHV